VKPPLGFVVVHGDGSRVTRFSVPRWLAWGALGCQAALLAAVAGLAGDHGHAAGEIAAVRDSADRERALVESFARRLPALRAELAGWRTVHAKLWKALAPDAAGIREPAPGDVERVVRRTVDLVNALPIRWPLRGPVNSEFGPRTSPWTGRPEQHHGIDIGSPPGTPVRAPATGTVVAANTHGRLGKHIAVDHGNGVTSLYGHLEAVDVKPGDRVAKGQVIGLVGSTGRSTGPHLHYELLVDGKPVDPRTFVGSR
jgi:murein DD-endopeptidase MepM/ murein hydrolase activator NlpD